MAQIFKTEECVQRNVGEKVKHLEVKIRSYIGMGSRSFKNHLVEVIRAKQGWRSVWKKEVTQNQKRNNVQTIQNEPS